MYGVLALLKRYKAVIRFIITFLGTYVILAFLYDLYLNNFQSTAYYPDYLTHMVAVQSEAVISTLGYEVAIFSGVPETSMHLMVNDVFVARIIEGCNSASIIILFIAFMLSFLGRLKPTLLYILAGAVIIYVINILRIAVLSIGIYELPQHAVFLHEIVFPLIIYGTVFILWVLWIRIYTKQVAI